MTRKKRSGCLNKIFNFAFTAILVAVTAWGLQQYSIAKASSLKFAHISDVHLSSETVNRSYRLTANSTELLDDAVNYINDIPNIDFVMFTGDMIDRPLEVEMKRFTRHANRLKYPYYTALGNHDVCLGGYLNKKLYVDIMKNANKSFKSNKPYFSFTPQSGYKAIVLDSIIDTRLTANGEISEEQLKWLDKELSTAKDKIVLIFMHVPAVEPLSSEGHRLLNADKFLEILSKYKNPIGVFTGHYHTTKITKAGNILHVSTPALISYPNAFRIINIENYKSKAVFHIEYVPTRLIHLQKKSKLLVFHASTYYGDEDDRTVTVTIEKR